jgi:outer membrane lipoprotein-sorting protein
MWKRGLTLCLVLGAAGALAPGRASAEGAPVASPSTAAPTATELLAASDRARGGIERGITWSVQLDSVEDGDKTERAYVVKARGADAYVETIAPTRSKGEVILFNDRTLWYYKPGLRSPVSISARQRLTGQAANGDIASTNYARDYAGVIVGEETLGEESTYKLELKAKVSTVTYDRIRYWISKNTRLAVKAEFLTVQGAPFKIATFEYGNKLTIAGTQYDFVRRMRITDAAFAQNVTVITYSEPHVAEHAPTLFNVNNLLR